MLDWLSGLIVYVRSLPETRVQIPPWSMSVSVSVSTVFMVSTVSCRNREGNRAYQTIVHIDPASVPKDTSE